MGVLDGNTPEVDHITSAGEWSFSPGPPRSWTPQDGFQSFSPAALGYSTLKKLQEGHCRLTSGIRCTSAVYSQLRPVIISLTQQCMQGMHMRWYNTQFSLRMKRALPMKMLLFAHERPKHYILLSMKTCDFQPLKFVFAHENFVLCLWNMLW